MSSTFVNIPGYTWLSPVQTIAELPPGGSLYDVRFVGAEETAYYFDGTSWLPFAGGGGGVASNSFAIIQTDTGTYPTATTPSDTLTFTSSNATVSIAGDSLTDTINLTVNPSFAVTSFNTRVGAVTSQSGDYTKAMVGLSNVDNTSDATKNSAVATLTNKTLSGNTATTLISGSGTLTLNTTGTVTVPNATDTLVGKATTDTLTNKTLTSPTLTGIPVSPTASQGNNSTQVATTAYVDTGLATKQASGSYLVTTNNLSDVASVNTSRTNLRIDKRTAVNNADYTILSTDVYVAQNGTLSAARTFTLPAANSVNAGYEIEVVDESGSVTTTNTITIQRAGADTINQTTLVTIATANAGRIFTSDGTSKWHSDRSYLRCANSLSDVLSASAARVNIGVDKRTAFSNADYTVLTTDKYVAQTGTMSTSRAVTLPTAASVNAGYEIIIGDESGTVSTSNMIVITRAGSDTIDGATTQSIGSAYGQRRLFSDGTSKWTFDAGVLRSSNNLSDVASASTALTNIGGAGIANLQTYTASGTWTKPTNVNANSVTRIYLLGGGGGAGSGRKGAAASVRCGGGGGAPSVIVAAEFLTSLLGATETVTVGTGGTGGAGQATNSTNGNTGGTGSDTTFGSWLKSPGGAPGAGGTTASGAGGSATLIAATPWYPIQLAGASASTTGGTGTAPTGSTIIGPTGGASGGGISSADAVNTGNTGGAVTPAVFIGATLAGGAAGSSIASAGNGNNTTAAFFGMQIGSGGGSSRGNIVTSGLTGGNGGKGAGGGGGGAVLDAVTNGGAGGNGGDGWLVAVTYN